MSYATKKNCNLPKHDDQESVALSNTGMLPVGTAIARELEKVSEMVPDVAIVVF